MTILGENYQEEEFRGVMQALECKERVPIQQETQTLANYLPKFLQTLRQNLWYDWDC